MEMNDDREKLMRVWQLDMEIASLTYKYFELYSDNKSISISLYGCLARKKNIFNRDVINIMDYYVFGKEF
jgi:hypothetical protein